MSQIFDALQRAEAERSGSGDVQSLRPTEVLARAERYAASQWRRNGVAADSESAERPQVEGRDVLDLKSPTESFTNTLPESRPMAEADRASTLDSFSTLKASLSEDSRLVSVTQKESAAAEAFRLLGVRIRDLRRNRELKKILITSSIPREGKSMVAANLACTLAQTTRQRVLLLEGDVRRPTQSEIFGMGTQPGLCEWLQGERSLTASIYRLESLGLWICPAGTSIRNPLELLQLGKVTFLMEQLTAWFDTIIIDSPPILPLADTSVWTRLTDGILLVTRQGATEKRQLQRGIDALDKQKLIGAMVNASRDMSKHDYYYRLPKTATEAGA